LSIYISDKAGSHWGASDLVFLSGQSLFAVFLPNATGFDVDLGGEQEQATLLMM